MKGPGIQDYLTEIKRMKEEAKYQNEEYLEISSKQLHAILSPNHATMPTCCQALYKCLLQGDEIMKRPKGHTGYGSHLVVKFYVQDLDRAPMFEPKRRGRPVKSESEKANRNKVSFSGNNLTNLIKVWLEERGWEPFETNKTIEANRDNEKWVIDVHKATRGRKIPLPTKIGDILKRMEDTNAHYSVAFIDNPMYRRQWNEIPTAVKDRLNISVILADRTGNIVEVK